MKIYNFEEKDVFRFLSKIQITNECWIPNLKKRKDGYTVFTIKRTKEYFGHRLAYSIFKGDLIDGLVIDHICRNKSCCNPDHLRQVTQSQNALENSESIMATNKIKTHCKNGHELSGSNLRLEKLSMGRSGFSRRCVTCTNARQRERYANK